ncbi:MAG: hypothetical protein HRU38_17015 [Saccharospirillaceae bacterium]|nr:hypothetical protein [Pseudomonadales bacterium]NRB80339.1 hypothetical protein [Saccharospirillaceae bacterium]
MIAIILLMVVLPVKAVDLVGFKAYPKLGVTQDELKQVLKFSATQQGVKIEDIARTLTLFYRDKGLSFHQVVVKKGKLVLIEGVLSDVSIQDPNWSTLINKAIGDLKGKVVFEPRIRNALLKLNLWPGIELFSFYSVADSFGGVNLNVIVKDSKKADIKVSIDNYGLALTGKNRLLLSSSIYNFLVKPSQLTFSGHVTDVTNNYSVSTNLIQYKSLDHLWKFNLSAQHLSLDNENQLFDLEGSNLSAKYAMQWNLQPTALKSNSKQIWLRFSQNELKSAINISSFNKTSAYLQLGSSYASSGISSNNKNQFNLNSQGVVGWTVEQQNEAPSEVISAKVRFNFNLRRDITKGLYNNQDLLLGISGQVGSFNMHSSERFALTGQTGLTQWEPSKASTEQGLILEAKLFLLQKNKNKLTYNLLVNTQAGLGYSKPSPDSEFLIKLAGVTVQSNITYNDISFKASYEQPIYVSEEGWDKSANVLFKVGYEKQF